MSRKAVIMAISRSVIWKETSKYLKHYRIISKWDMDLYNIQAWKLIALYRDTEYQINNNWLKINKFEFRKMIQDLEKGD